MRVVIDMGVQKTGSKSRQAFFVDGLSSASGGAAGFLRSGRAGGWHQSLFESLRRGDVDVLQLLVNELSGCRWETAILSYEAMHELGDAGIERLAAAIPGVEAVVFLRRQDEFLNSLHNQLHKAHRRDLASIRRFEQGLDAIDPRCDYASILSRWERGLGPGRVHSLIYDPRGCSVRRFFEAMGKPEWAPSEPAWRNAAVDAFGLTVLRELKSRVSDVAKLPAVIDAAHRRLVAHFAPPGRANPHWSLRRSQRMGILERYAASNAAVRKRFFPDRTDLFPESLPALAVQVEGDDAQVVVEEILASVSCAGASPARA